MMMTDPALRRLSTTQRNSLRFSAFLEKRGFPGPVQREATEVVSNWRSPSVEADLEWVDLDALLDTIDNN